MTGLCDIIEQSLTKKLEYAKRPVTATSRLPEKSSALSTYSDSNSRSSNNNNNSLLRRSLSVGIWVQLAIVATWFIIWLVKCLYAVYLYK